ncbi:hypothetical protein [uncultured Sphingomonas sp.]|uniref:hypothetical protein n=1 Tax=uncultured Sphingomonas sp. TaxID=158754 RepID=UPI00374956C9
MDALYFLRSRTGFIRFFYAQGAQRFVETKLAIEEERPPFDKPPWREDGEPAYLEEWLNADAALEVLGMACISMLSDTLKMYFKTLQERVIRFSFGDGKAAFREGFVPAYLTALGEFLDTDWSDCPVDRELIEQIVLARNRSQHGGDLTSFTVTHDKATLEKHPRPFFVGGDEISALTSERESLGSLLMPTVKVSADGLERAIAEVEALGDYVEARLDRVQEWRRKAREG